MKALLRAFVSIVATVATFFFVFWLPGSLLITRGSPTWVRDFVSFASAIFVAQYTWRHTASVSQGLVSSILLGALVIGGIGFSAGFFGPMILTPESNQGPLLGIFITGPLGFLAGAVGGAIRWTMRDKSKAEPALDERESASP